MSKSHRSSHASERCRLEWRPSRLLAAWLLVMGVLAAIAVLASDMPRGAAWLIALAALLHAWQLAARERGRAPVALDWDGRAGVVRIDGVAVDGARLRWRGPLAFLSWRDAHGRTRHLAWWPDTLPAACRRELRLAAGGGDVSPGRGAMAP